MKLYANVPRTPKAQRSGCGGGCFLLLAFWIMLILFLMTCCPEVHAQSCPDSKYRFVEDTTNYIKSTSDSVVDSVIVSALLFQSIGDGKDLLICEPIWLKTATTLNLYSVNGETYTYWEIFNKLIFTDMDGCEIMEERIFMFKYNGGWQTPDE